MFKEVSIAEQLEDAVLADARVLWDYHRLGLAYDQADVILGLGSYDLSVADFAAQLFLKGHGTWLLFSGGIVSRNDLLQTPWDRAEAFVFGERARELGVPITRMLLEADSKNTGENFRFSLAVMRERQIDCKTLLVVTKPNMERRARATAMVNVPPSIKVTVTSSPAGFDEYCLTVAPKRLISLMVGDLQRIALYPTLGFQALEIVPPHVDASFRRLVAAGFTSHLLPQVSKQETPL
ncbi:MAG TPA: YdcF family protein [Terriglobales bacterium]